MDEAVLFEQYIGTVEQVNRLFVRLSCDQKYGLEGCIPINMSMAEGMSIASPIINISFVDSIGIYSNIEKFSPSATFWLSFGNDFESSIRIAMKFSSITMTNATAAKSDSIAFTICFVTDGWNEMLNKRTNRAWTNKTIGNIVTDISSEGKYTNKDISSDSFQIPLVIQPYWSNVSLLNQLQKKYSHSTYNDHFEYCGTLEGNFFFKSVSEIIKENSEKALNGDVPVIRLEGPEFENIERVKQKLENSNYPTNFVSYIGNEYYMDSTINGAGGVVSMYYDFTSGTYKKETKTIASQNAIQLADWNAIQTSHEVSQARLNCGRDVNAGKEGNSLVSSVAFSASKVRLTVEGSIGVRTGHLIEIIIPANEYLIAPYNVIHSGFYVVSGVSHMIGLDSNQSFNTIIHLARQGYDGKELEGYTKTKRGKFST